MKQALLIACVLLVLGLDASSQDLRTTREIISNLKNRGSVSACAEDNAAFSDSLRVQSYAVHLLEMYEREAYWRNAVHELTWIEDHPKELPEGDLRYYALTARLNAPPKDLKGRPLSERMALQKTISAAIRKLWSDARATSRPELIRTIDSTEAKITKLDQKSRDGRCGGATTDVSGTWDLVCCSGRYTGKLTLTQSGNKIGGYFGETSNGSTGKVDGAINGTSLTFRRTWSGGVQDYTLTLSSDGKTLTGSFNGTRDTSVGTEFRATRH
ncbi:MAG TPA: hypothetical protein VGO43_15620 [Pyrinomonadaceae bacterium]|nr:hypothetical protein [Pyrinomonadaceae bacterium]